ncbi:anillin, actin binding protein 2 isoform X2 [Phyllopteryx taeniolatus]|uniref:anillin, actin binding protein 2 isoform X2 n=1 Tax=Phyllopteryx taeniolatus TaxID=161469 RepID=UPI002AD4610D|nr:anillin, actin binding protein 2 isoform X2 [Phyllopteryx taeniolatus]
MAEGCMPGTGDNSSSTDKVLKDHILSETAFNQRMDRLKEPFCPSSPDTYASPAKPRVRALSNVVSGIQQKLQGDATPSSQQFSRIRQEREQELNQLPFQPISENAWLKRSSSDPLLFQGRTPGLSSPSSGVPRSKRVVQWPPMQQWHVDDNGRMNNGSYIEADASGARNGSLTVCSPGDHATSVGSEANIEGQLQFERKEKNTAQCDNDGEQRLEKPDDQPGHVFIRVPGDEDQNKSELSACEEQNHLESSRVEESNIAYRNISNVTEPRGRAEENLKDCESSYGDETMELSTEEELRLWRYPTCQGPEFGMSENQVESVCDNKDHRSCEPPEENKPLVSSVAQHSGPTRIQEGEHRMANVFVEIHKDVTPRRKRRRCESESCTRDQGSEQCCLPSLKNDEGVEESCKKVKVETSAENITNNNESELGPDEGDGYRQLEVNDTPLSKNVTPLSKNLEEIKQRALDGCQSMVDRGRPEETYTAEGGAHSINPELDMISASSSSGASMELRGETSVADVEVSSLDETNTAEIIDQMFEEVLEYAERKDEKQYNEEDTEDQDSGISNCCGEKERVNSELESEKSREYLDANEKECEKFESNGDELLTFPPDGILSPLSKFVEAVVTPLKRKRQASGMDACPESLVLTPKETPRFPVETAPLYSIDAYRTQRQSKVLATQCVTPGIQRGVPEKPHPQSSTSIKEKILALNEEAAKLQTVIKQTLQALSCCTDVEHGRGSLEEAEAEKLLLVSCEKCSALQAEVVRLREEKSSDSKGEGTDMQQACRGTVSITNIQLPLKLEYVCSSHNSSGRPSYYFFILIRYGPCNIVSTPLATAADAQNGDTISFSTSVTLKDIRSTFEIDVEVYSLSPTSGTNSGIDHSITRSRVTPKKLLNTLTHRTSNNLASPAFPTLCTRRSSNFCLVGSHKITLASLGHNKFLLDKVPFLSPLEGHIYLQLDSESHSCVRNQGFLTMFEVISGYGAWHRRYFILDGCTMLYWNHPNDKESKAAEGVISLSSSPNQCVRAVNRDSCARPYTFELVSNVLQQDDNNGAFAKCWFSADTKQEKLNWIEKLSQALLDFHTWNRSSEIHTEMQQSNNSSGNLRESIL